MEFGKILVLVVTIFIGISNTFRIGAFNLKVYGPKKSKDVKVMSYIVKIIQRYDIILLQEIRDISGESINVLENAVNTGTNIKYDMIVSKRLGDSSSKEQYIFFYRRNGITVLSSYVYGDPRNEFEREPFIVKFKVTNAVTTEFVLAGIHVRPSEAIEEITALETVKGDIISRMKNENILFLGDMNAECSYAPKYKLDAIPIRMSTQYHWLIGDDVDTTVSKGTDCAYDRFILYGDRFLSSIVDNSSGIFPFDKVYRLSDSEALAVSDHYPIELELETVTSSAPYIPYTMFTTVCIGSVICSCYYCLRG